MWNNHQALNLLSTILFTLVATIALYAISLRFMDPPFFPIKEINIQVIDGAKSDTQELLNVAHEQIEYLVKNEIRGNFISVDLAEVRKAFIKLPWIRDVRVNRKWPHSLNIMLEEHQSLAYWGSHALVNTYGEVFRVTVNKNLPIFNGPTEASAQEVARQYTRFSKILLPLQQTIVEINLTPRYAWRIQLDTGAILELGRDEIEERLIRYVSVYNHTISRFSQEGSLAYVDLRYQNGFAIRVPEAIQYEARKSISRDKRKSLEI